jgi:hypothetical protein
MTLQRKGFPRPLSVLNVMENWRFGVMRIPEDVPGAKRLFIVRTLKNPHKTSLVFK